MRRFAITATVAPGREDAAALVAFAAAGATRIRLNASHAGPERIRALLAAADEATARGNFSLPLVFDLQGAKPRLGVFPERQVEAGARIVLALEPEPGGAAEIPFPHPEMVPRFVAGAAVLFDDGRVAGTVEAVGASRIVVRIERPGPLSARRGVSLPGVAPPLFRPDGATEALIGPLLRWPGAAAGRAELALSYARDPAELQALADAAPGMRIVAKVETRAAFARLAPLLDAADETWLCRGDLGAEAGLAALPDLERAFRAAARNAARPWTMAGEVLHPLRAGESITRTECVYLAGLLEEGASGIVLSDETVRSADPCAPVTAARRFLDERAVLAAGGA